jgi:hypothetical protein
MKNKDYLFSDVFYADVWYGDDVCVGGAVFSYACDAGDGIFFF